MSVDDPVDPAVEPGDRLLHHRGMIDVVEQPHAVRTDLIDDVETFGGRGEIVARMVDPVVQRFKRDDDTAATEPPSRLAENVDDGAMLLFARNVGQQIAGLRDHHAGAQRLCRGQRNIDAEEESLVLGAIRQRGDGLAGMRQARQTAGLGHRRAEFTQDPCQRQPGLVQRRPDRGDILVGMVPELHRIEPRRLRVPDTIGKRWRLDREQPFDAGRKAAHTTTSCDTRSSLPNRAR